MGYRERNREKLEQFYRDYGDDVYRVCAFFTKDKELAYDMAQQTFFTLYQHIDEVDSERVKGFLIRLARNISLNCVKARKYEKLHDSWERISEEAITIVSVEEAYVREEEARQEVQLGKDIMEHIRKENEQWYTALNMLFCLGKPHDVVADEMGISRDALYSMVYRARKWVRKNYMKKCNDIRN